jgi:enoyl-CoA hydratase/carnithine racemase
MPFETIVVTCSTEGWAEVLFNRPAVRNAINRLMVEELTAALEGLARDPAVRGLVLHGAGGKAFVAGADISELLVRNVDDALSAINARVFQLVEDFPWPVIAAIQGYALGGGCELALACDIRLAAPDAQFGQPEVKLGIIPGAGAPHRLTRAVGTALARELIFTGRLVGAEEALRCGLINRIVAPPASPLDAARELMREILKNAPMAVRLAKVALNAAVNTVDRRATMVEYLSQGILFESDDKKKRMTAFLEKKKS